MSALLCPNCEKGAMKWVGKLGMEIEALDTTVMECKKCGIQYVGMGKYFKAIEDKHKK